jgi:hypothetical protein
MKSRKSPAVSGKLFGQAEIPLRTTSAAEAGAIGVSVSVMKGTESSAHTAMGLMSRILKTFRCVDCRLISALES